MTVSDLGNGISAASFTIPAQKELGTLLWRDEASGLYCRLQSILNQETLLRLAESMCSDPPPGRPPSAPGVPAAARLLPRRASPSPVPEHSPAKRRPQNHDGKEPLL